MTTLIAHFPDLNLVAIPEMVRGREISFSKTKNRDLADELVLGNVYNIVYDGEIRSMLFQRSPLNSMFLFDV